MYLRTGSADLAIAPYTTDGDVVLNPSLLKSSPGLETAWPRLGSVSSLRPAAISSRGSGWHTHRYTVTIDSGPCTGHKLCHSIDHGPPETSAGYDFMSLGVSVRSQRSLYEQSAPQRGEMDPYDRGSQRQPDGHRLSFRLSLCGREQYRRRHRRALHSATSSEIERSAQASSLARGRRL